MALDKSHRSLSMRPADTLPQGITLLRTLEGRSARVLSLAFAPSGDVLASATGRSVEIWELHSGGLLTELAGHYDWIHSVAYTHDGRTMASASSDKTVKLWHAGNGKLRRTIGSDYRQPFRQISFTPDGEQIAAASDDQTVKIWEVGSGKLIRTLKGHEKGVQSVSYDPAGQRIASGSADSTVRLWGVGSGRLLRSLEGHRGAVRSVAFGPGGRLVASGADDRTINVWEAGSGKLIRTLEGHTEAIDIVVFAPDGRLLASKSRDDSIRLWRCDTWETVAIIKEPTDSRLCVPALAFHPTLPLLATAGSEGNVDEADRCRLIHLLELDVDALLSAQATTPAVHYVNAKVVLVGDTGVGKSGLSLVLNEQPFEATDSTPGRHVWTFDSREVALHGERKELRETLLWDLAGQPGYRVIHQLHLNEVAVALVIFDARSETDPLAGVRHWERALRLAHQRAGIQSIPMRKLLVSARADRGGVSVSKERIDTVKEQFGFDGYFETSAKEGWQISELRAAIELAIPWSDLPVVTSEELFVRIKSFLLDVKQSGRLLASALVLYDDFARQEEVALASRESLRAQFETCIGRLENRDLIRRLSFGGYVLLQPELLDAYASALVNAAKNEPDGLGSIAEDVALGGKFHVPEEQRVIESGQEQLLLHAMVEELVQHDLGLRESADDGSYLVFPSQFNRDYEDAPEPKGTVLAITFEGPVQSLYSTLAVRLGHSGLFEIGRTEMWRNAAIFAARAGGKCGMYVREFEEGRGQLLLFFEPEASVETRFHFEEYALSHLTRRAIDNSVELIRFFVCSGCSTPVPDAYVKMLRSKGSAEFSCPCGAIVSIAEPKEELARRYPSQVDAMDRAANRRRDFDAFIVSASGETRTKNFMDWAGGERVTLAIVFTDVVASTALENEIGSERMSEVRQAHFSQARKFVRAQDGREIKTIGDSFMVAFRNVDSALDFAIALHSKTGHNQVRIRAGVHVGPMHVEGNDLFGGTVNFAARVASAAQRDEIWLSARSMEDIRGLKARRHDSLTWEPHDGVLMKGFPGVFTLWSLAR